MFVRSNDVIALFNLKKCLDFFAAMLYNRIKANIKSKGRPMVGYSITLYTTDGITVTDKE